MSDTVPDVLIIGSGPAGVSAAFPLIERGLSVCMIEAGDAVAPPALQEAHASVRARAGAWRSLFGEDLEAMVPEGGVSPKFRIPRFAPLLAGGGERLQIDLSGTAGRLIAAEGGMSVAWGAGVGVFGPEDLERWPISANDLAGSYRTVAARIGISGDLGPDAPEGLQPAAHPGLHPSAARLLERQARWRADGGVTLRPGASAVVVREKDGRAACERWGNCLYGCARDSIWSAAADLRILARAPRFTLRSGALVTELARTSEGWTARLLLTSGETQTVTARRVVCAAGAIGSAALVMKTLGLRTPRRLLSTPTGAFALIIPARIGQPWEERFFGLTQLSITIRREGPTTAFGGLFATEGVPIQFLQVLSPLSWRGTFNLFRGLAPACLLGNLFFDGEWSDHTVGVSAEGVVKIRSTVRDGFAAHAQRVFVHVRRRLLALGAIAAPARLSLSAPGSDLHFAGAVPMSARPQIGDADAFGGLAGAEDFVVVDGALLPSLPPKPHTLTIMANADRVARHWAERWPPL